MSEIIGEAKTIPLNGQPCNCSHRHFKDSEIIFENKTFLLYFGPVEITKRDGTVIHKGWGINLINHKSSPDRAYVFNYCPWCGGKLHE